MRPGLYDISVITVMRPGLYDLSVHYSSQSKIFIEFLSGACSSILRVGDAEQEATTCGADVININRENS